jgi:hypothetical protein
VSLQPSRSLPKDPSPELGVNEVGIVDDLNRTTDTLCEEVNSTTSGIGRDSVDIAEKTGSSVR